MANGNNEKEQIISSICQTPVEALVARIAAGDHAAETELVRVYANGVQVLLLHRTNDRDLADDLFQQTIQIAIERLRAGALKDPSRLSGYVRQIALNLITTHFRRNKGEWSAFDSQIESVACQDDDPIRTIMRWDRIRLVQRAIDSLESARDRTVLRRYYVDSQAKERICKELGLTSALFDTVISRARARLREFIEREEQVEDY